MQVSDATLTKLLGKAKNTVFIQPSAGFTPDIPNEQPSLD